MRRVALVQGIVVVQILSISRGMMEHYKFGEECGIDKEEKTTMFPSWPAESDGTSKSKWTISYGQHILQRSSSSYPSLAFIYSSLASKK